MGGQAASHLNSKKMQRGQVLLCSSVYLGEYCAFGYCIDVASRREGEQGQTVGLAAIRPSSRGTPAVERGWGLGRYLGASIP